MTLRSAAAALALLLLWSAPAAARDPFREEHRSEPAPPARDSDPAPFIAPPPGVYYVTDTYVADVVTASGTLTTYLTTTVHESTGSYARVLETVGTGASSVYDGSAFNGRRSLGDGRPVAGTYYQNYVLTEGGFVPVSIVFFQDDSELARLQSVDNSPPAGAPSHPQTPTSNARPLAPTCCAAERPAGVAAPPIARTKPIRPGISLLPVSAPLTTLEVLRGRAVELWPRAFIDDREVPVRSWSVIGGEAGEALATAGSGSVPFRSRWTRLAPPGATWEVVFRIEVDTPDGGRRTVNGAIAVVVRSPALEN
jgi:hypothetical protein